MKRKIDSESLPLKNWKKEATMFQDDYTAGAGTSWLLNVAKAENKMIWEMIRAIEEAPTLTPPNEPPLLEFDVVDTTTGKYPDWERIAREEAWAKGLVYCDMDGVAIREDGSLILLDECGNCVSCPPDRFEIRRPLAETADKMKEHLPEEEEDA